MWSHVVLCGFLWSFAAFSSTVLDRMSGLSRLAEINIFAITASADVRRSFSIYTQFTDPTV